MKIGIVCPYNMFQFAGGVQDVVVQLHHQLKNKGHQVKVITPRPRNYNSPAPQDYILLGRSAKVNTMATMVDLGFEAGTDEIDNILATEKFDIIHFHEPWVPLLSRQILARSSAVNVATFHAKSPDTLISKSLISSVVPYTKSVLKYLDALTAVSPAASEYVKNLTNRHIEIVPNGIDLNRFKFSDQDSNTKTILFLGRLEKRKGLEYLLDAYQLLKNKYPEVVLKIAGSGAKRKSLEKYIDQNKISDVTFLGFIPESEKVSLMTNATVYCSPAPYGESFGIVLLESMAVGTPVVAGNNAGYSGVMTGTGMLSLVNPRSTQDFAQRLELMLYNADVRKLWRQWAKQEVYKYRFENIADMYENVYKKALKENGL
jgi:phosphatidylinositol alpha-mannosyltransferase